MSYRTEGDMEWKSPSVRLFIYDIPPGPLRPEVFTSL